MPQLIVVGLVSVAIAASLYLFVLGYSQHLVRVLVEKKHRDAEVIEGTQLAPPGWRTSLFVRFGGPEIRKRYALRRIERLISYFRTTSMVDSEQTRQVIVDSLADIRDEWRSKTWSEICPYQ